MAGSMMQPVVVKKEPAEWGFMTEFRHLQESVDIYDGIQLHFMRLRLVQAWQV